MLRLFSRAQKPTRTGQFRARLRLESLEWRDQPSGLTEDDPTGGSTTVYAAPVNVAPQIVDFTAEQVGNGLFIFSGRVIDELPSGLTVTFGGGVQSVSGLTATTDANGNFYLTVRVQTDGTDTGTVSAITTDPQGLQSNEALVYVSPTPP